jgi:hypothetical protein
LPVAILARSTLSGNEARVSDEPTAGADGGALGTTAERATLLIAVPSASVAFTLAFNLGAFGTVFFDAIFTAWVIATLVLVGSLVSRLPPQSWWGRFVLFVPSLWFLASWIVDPAAEGGSARVIFALTIFITVVCLPLIAWILISAINPEFLELPNSNKAAIVAAVVLFAASGYFVGARNDIFLDCGDFKVSGNDLPSNCVSVPAAPNPGG